jgi:hypothetical protein
VIVLFVAYSDRMHSTNIKTITSSCVPVQTDRAEGDHVHQPTPTTARVFTPPNRQSRGRPCASAYPHHRPSIHSSKPLNLVCLTLYMVQTSRHLERSLCGEGDSVSPTLVPARHNKERLIVSAATHTPGDRTGQDVLILLPGGHRF